MGKQSKAVLRPRSRKGKASSESQSSRSQPVLRSRSEIGAREEPEDEAEESEDGEQEGESGKKKVRRRRRVKRTKGESEEGKSKKVRRVRRRRSQREREEAKEDEEEEEDDDEAEPAKDRSSSRKRPEVDSDTVDLLRKLIHGVYERCAPDKLSKLPSIFEKYDGLEAEVYRKACRKYGVTPEIDLSQFEADGKAEKNTTKAAPTSTARNGSDRLQRDRASGPKPGSGGSWPFVEDYEGNSSCSSDEKIVKQDRRPPGSWQPKAWTSWTPPGYVTPGSWVPPTGTPGAWVPPVEAKATAPKPPSEAEKLDPDLKDLLFGRSHPMMPPMAVPSPGPPPPGPPPPGTSPFEPRMHVPGQAGAPYQSGRQELQLEDFLGEWRDSMGHKVEVDWARNSSRGQLEVSLSKKGRDAIRLNVKQLGPGRFACGHYQLEMEKSGQYKIVWEDRQKNKTSIWER